jgi:hypothetical protein
MSSLSLSAWLSFFVPFLQILGRFVDAIHRGISVIPVRVVYRGGLYYAVHYEHFCQ